MPVYRAKYSYAITFLNRRTDGTPSEVNNIKSLDNISMKIRDYLSVSV